MASKKTHFAFFQPSAEQINEFRKLALDITGGGSGGGAGTPNGSGGSSGSAGALSPTSSRRNNVATMAKDYKKLGFRVRFLKMG